jgi:Mg2+ and Co2+ transporter CorA
MNLALLDNMQLSELSEAKTAGAAIGSTIAVLGQFVVPVGLFAGIWGMIDERPRLRNRGFVAAGIGVAMFMVGAALAGTSLKEPQQ